MYNGIWLDGNRTVTVKVQYGPFERRENAERLLIVSQFNLWKVMNETRGFPLIYAAEMTGDYKYMVMQHVGKSLEVIANEGRCNFLEETLPNVLSQLVDRIQSIHDKGFRIHGLRQDNIAMDTDQTLYFINAEFSEGYIAADIRPSRVYDLNQLISFILLEVYKTWSSEDAQITRNKCTGKKKWLLPALDYLSSVDYGEAPDYGKFKQLLLASRDV